MLDVFFTVDVEVWCDGWDRLDEHFPAALERYIYGRTPTGDYGLPTGDCGLMTVEGIREC